MCDPVTCASMTSFLETCKPCSPKESSKCDPEIQRKQKNLEDMKQFAQSLTPKDLMTQKCEAKDCINNGSCIASTTFGEATGILTSFWGEDLIKQVKVKERRSKIIE